MGKQKKKTRRDVAEIARANLEQIIGEKLNGQPLDESNTEQPIGRGSAGGKKGGPIRAAILSKERRREIAKRAAEARWRKRRS